MTKESMTNESESDPHNAIVGYIVMDAERWPMWEESRAGQKERRGVLWIARRDVTMFLTRAAARAAIKRTNDYAYRNGLTGAWKTDYTIKAVRLHERI